MPLEYALLNEDDDTPDTAPPLSPLPLSTLFATFLRLGGSAWGGPAVQITALHTELVAGAAWVTEPVFRRALALYSVLPGPEATELCVFLGVRKRGLPGGLLAGAGFVLPGLALTLAAAALYSSGGLSSGTAVAVLGGLRACTLALCFRAIQKLVKLALYRAEGDSAPPVLDPGLVLVSALAAFDSVLGVNFFVTKAHCVLVYLAYRAWAAAGRDKQPPPRLWLALPVLATLVPVAAACGIIAKYGPLDALLPKGLGIASHLGNTPAGQFCVGLVGGLLSFGGAWSTLPIVQWEVVTSGGWVSQAVFLDALALTSLLPSPLVLYVVFVGWAAGLAGGAGAAATGALLMAAGMLVPAFVMPLLLHDALDNAMQHSSSLRAVMDALAATVVGLTGVVALQLARQSLSSPLALLIAGGCRHVLDNAPPGVFTLWGVILGSGVAGYVLLG